MGGARPDLACIVMTNGWNTAHGASSVMTTGTAGGPAGAGVSVATVASMSHALQLATADKPEVSSEE